MDIRWRDGNDNILNANAERILYYDSEKDNKIKILKEEIKVIEVEDGLMNIYRDFDNDLIVSVIVPKAKSKEAKKIFNEFDRTGKSLKGNTGAFLLDLILESSMILGNPFIGGVLILGVIAFVLSIVLFFIKTMFGETGLFTARGLIFIYVIYVAICFILTKIKRKRLKEI